MTILQMTMAHGFVKRRAGAALALAGLALLLIGAVPRPAAAAELVMFEARGCSWCRVWHEEIGPIYPKTEEARFAPLRRVDIDEPLPADLSGYADIHFTPTFVLISGGREIGRIRGYPGEDFFWGLLDELIARAAKAPAG